jgi:hypothetical protein
LPNNAVFCGTDTNGDLIYVGRFPYASDMLPAKIITAKRNAFAAYDGKEVLESTYEVSSNESLHSLKLKIIKKNVF